MKDGTDTKLKFKQLQRALNLTLWQARGLLDTLWTFARNNCPRGDIGRFTDDEIAIGIDWHGNAQELLKTLTDARWVDPCGECRLVVHDWPEHCEDSVHKVLIKTTETFADGTFPSLARMEKKQRPQIIAAYQHKYGKEAWKNGKAFIDARERPETPENAPTIPSLALPNHTLPSQPANGADPAGWLAGSSLISWEQVGSKLAALPLSRWRESLEQARGCGCTPELALQVIDYAAEKGYGPGAVAFRLQRSSPSLPLSEGWPLLSPKEDPAEKASRDRDARALAAKRISDAEKIIKAGRSNQMLEGEIIAQLKAKGLEWPK